MDKKSQKLARQPRIMGTKGSQGLLINDQLKPMPRYKRRRGVA